MSLFWPVLDMVDCYVNRLCAWGVGGLMLRDARRLEEVALVWLFAWECWRRLNLLNPSNYFLTWLSSVPVLAALRPFGLLLFIPNVNCWMLNLKAFLFVALIGGAGARRTDPLCCLLSSPDPLELGESATKPFKISIRPASTFTGVPGPVPSPLSLSMTVLALAILRIASRSSLNGTDIGGLPVSRTKAGPLFLSDLIYWTILNML